MGTLVGVAALVLYVREWVRVEPRIVNVWLRKGDDGTCRIEAYLSNEGGRKATGCTAGIEIGDNLVESLAFVPVDSPAGRIGTDWPEKTRFDMYPRRIFPVRGYIKRPKDTRISLVLRRDDQEMDRLSFSLP